MLEILESIPRETNAIECALRDGRRMLKGELAINLRLIVKLNVARAIAESPHYRELAEETLWYLNRQYEAIHEL